MSRADTTFMKAMIMAFSFPHSIEQSISVWFAEGARCARILDFLTWYQTCLKSRQVLGAQTLTHTPGLHCLKLCLSIYSTLLSCICGTCIYYMHYISEALSWIGQARCQIQLYACSSHYFCTFTCTLLFWLFATWLWVRQGVRFTLCTLMAWHVYLAVCILCI